MAIDLNQEINLDDLRKRWHGWHLKNTFFLIDGMILFFFLASVPQVDSFIRSLGTLGLFGAFLVGFFFVLTYTAVPAAFVLFELAKYNNPLEIALIAAVGSMLGDYLIFRFIKDRIVQELKPYLAKIGTPKVKHLFKTPYFAWLLPVLGALIIASPAPDEVGVGLMGAAKVKNSHFLIFSYALNAIGIFIVVLLARSL
ncbi:hypothetical protein HYW36_02460 [Candidatus Saccharibacteria bacterium]|nr:hypothetical protein [Candidatus Saccharibacteria bacterium]